jgi:hypothetical protein
MRKILIPLMMIGALSLPVESARADIFGADVAVLAQILVQAIQQLMQLEQIFKNGSDQLEMMRNINRGINDSLNLIRTISPNSNPGIFSDWQNASQAMRVLTDVYGSVVPSKDANIQTNTDQSVAEAVALNNSIYAYSQNIDEIGEEIKSDSHMTSPGGAQKLTAESMGVMLHVMNTSLRAQATSLKLQAEMLAVQNHKDKEASRETVEASDALTTAIQNQNPQFQTPRF